ncbi:MAG: SurA N-terminal domain-containing protein [Chloroflexota bacterium]|nr:SurA N-terminal domain-containing protein [Chloroflexota bacterium]
MPEQTNPYSTLQVTRDASIEQIEESYDRLFDRYEPKAHAGDPFAISKLNQLNDAREILLDPAQRAELDARLSGAAATLEPVGARSEPVGGSDTIRMRRRGPQRPRTVAPAPKRSIILPLVVSGAFAVVVLALAAYLAFRNQGLPPAVPASAAGQPTDVVATVNGVPIYRKDFDKRLAIDKNTSISDPLFQPFFNNFQGVTGTRALDALKYDALDKLVNLEVIQQQAKKEGLFPNSSQAQQLIADTEAQDSKSLKAGQTFTDSLKERDLTEDEYDRNVIRDVVYEVMANEHLPKTGTGDQRTEGFIKWICTTRQSYQVDLRLTFIVKENTPCSSGLPSDLPLPIPADAGGTPGTVGTPGAVGTAAPLPGDEPTQVPPISPAQPPVAGSTPVKP